MSFGVGRLRVLAASFVAALGSSESVQFQDVTRESGISFRNVSGEPQKRFVVSSLGSGVALLDFDADGDLDVFFVNGSAVTEGKVVPAGPNRLYRNDGSLRFEDVTTASGVGHTGFGLGAAVGDYDNDGFSDLYVTNIGANVLYRNRGDGTFEDVTERAGVGDPGMGTSALFFDADADGDLDLYAANYSEADVATLPLPGSRPSCVWFELPVFCGPSGLKGVPDVYFRNDGDGTFTDATRAAGLYDASGAYGLGVVAGDYDGDGDVDLYVANDSVPNFLYQNDGAGGFQEAALYSGVAYNADGLAQAGMGVDLADVDGDGRLDIHVTNFSHDTNTMYRNAGSGVFADATTQVDLRSATWFYLGWATRLADFDNDGRIDLFVANGHVYPNAEDANRKTSYHQRNQLFWNREGMLVERDAPAGDAFEVERSSRGAAIGDLDNDGDLDIVVSDIDAPPSVIRNEIGGRSVTLALVGRASNRSAVGARVVTGGRVFEARPSGSYLSSSDPRIHIGLGSETQLSGTIVWPSGVEQPFAPLEAGTIVTIVEP